MVASRILGRFRWIIGSMKRICTGPLEFTPYRPWSEARREAARAQAKAGTYWIGERPAIVKRMWGEGSTFKEIAEYLGGISRSAVASFIRRNGLTRAPVAKEPEDLPEYFEDCYWPAERMKEAVCGTFGEVRFKMKNRTHRAGLFLFGCTIIWPDAEIVAEATGLQPEECSHFYEMARAGAIVIDGKVDEKPWIEGSPSDSAISFVLDSLLVAEHVLAEGERGPARLYSFHNA